MKRLTLLFLLLSFVSPVFAGLLVTAEKTPSGIPKLYHNIYNPVRIQWGQSLPGPSMELLADGLEIIPDDEGWFMIRPAADTSGTVLIRIVERGYTIDSFEAVIDPAFPPARVEVCQAKTKFGHTWYSFDSLKLTPYFDHPLNRAHFRITSFEVMTIRDGRSLFFEQIPGNRFTNRSREGINRIPISNGTVQGPSAQYIHIQNIRLRGPGAQYYTLPPIDLYY